MKTYYCVTSSFDDRGRATANITDMIKAEEKPESTYTSTRRKDIYNDWFESEKEAQEYVEQTRIAQGKGGTKAARQLKRPHRERVRVSQATINR